MAGTFAKVVPVSPLMFLYVTFSMMNPPGTNNLVFFQQIQWDVFQLHGFVWVCLKMKRAHHFLEDEQTRLNNVENK